MVAEAPLMSSFQRKALGHIGMTGWSKTPTTRPRRCRGGPNSRRLSLNLQQREFTGRLGGRGGATTSTASALVSTSRG